MKKLLLPTFLTACLSAASASAAVTYNSLFQANANAANATTLTFDSTDLAAFTTTTEDKLV